MTSLVISVRFPDNQVRLQEVHNPHQNHRTLVNRFCYIWTD